MSSSSNFEDELDDLKYEKGVEEDAELSAEDLQELVVRFKAVYEQRSLAFPQDVLEQLQLASTSRLVSVSVSYLCRCLYLRILYSTETEP